MPHISVDPNIVTLINTFTTTPEHREQVMNIIGTVGPLASAAPGWISASVHLSLDGSRIVNYVQWRSVADFEAFVADPRLQAALASLQGIAEVDPRLYTVAHVTEPPGTSTG